ncbi:unnamed protein product [Dicrocoelium dendriticum]|nr:unnamed protein product [Dicrocoelium dendriticum]
MILLGRSFDSFYGFNSLFSEYMLLHHVNFVCYNSRKCNLSRVKYYRVIYRFVRCARGSQKVQECEDSRNAKCQARVNLIRTGRKLKVTTFDLSHNHPVNGVLFERHPINRRLTYDEFTPSVELFRYNTPTGSRGIPLKQRYCAE